MYTFCSSYMCEFNVLFILTWYGYNNCYSHICELWFTIIRAMERMDIIN